MLYLYRPAINPTCAAFPAGIPDDIMMARFDHRRPYPGDHGFRFAPKKGFNPAAVDISLAEARQREIIADHFRHAAKDAK